MHKYSNTPLTATATVVKAINANYPGNVATSEIPDDADLRATSTIVVTRTGGFFQTPVSDRATMLIECFHPNSGLEAEKLANQIRALLRNARQTTYGTYRLIHWRETSGPVAQRHPSGAYRFQFMGNVTVPAI